MAPGGLTTLVVRTDRTGTARMPRLWDRPSRSCRNSIQVSRGPHRWQCGGDVDLVGGSSVQDPSASGGGDRGSPRARLLRVTTVHANASEYVCEHSIPTDDKHPAEEAAEGRPRRRHASLADVNDTCGTPRVAVAALALGNTPERSAVVVVSCGRTRLGLLGLHVCEFGSPPGLRIM